MKWLYDPYEDNHLDPASPQYVIMDEEGFVVVGLARMRLSVAQEICRAHNAAEEGALLQDGVQHLVVECPWAESEYTMKDGETSCWVTVGNISVFILRAEMGVEVHLYPINCEAGENIGVVWAAFATADKVRKELGEA